jgi:O-antigen ligase
MTIDEYRLGLLAPRALLGRSVGAGSVLVAAALPLLFLHLDAQPQFSLGGGVDADLSDLAVLALALAAAVSAARDGIEPLRSGRGLWIASGLLLAGIAISVAYGSRQTWYPTGTHAITAAKFAEYAAIALALPLLLRTTRDLVAPAAALLAWSVCATAFGLLQFLGLVRNWDRTPAGWRKESFLGYHNFAALSAAVLALVLIALAFGVEGKRRLGVVAALSGVAGMVIGGPLDALIGIAVALAAILLLGRSRGTLTLRRALVAVALVAVVAGGVVLIRGSTIEQTLRFFGAAEKQAQTTSDVQSWPQRALLAYIGGRIFLDHPLLGVGWQGSGDPPAFRPYLAAAHRRFDQPPRAFPSEQHPWGVQNAFVQAAADMGIVGLLLFLALFVSTALTAGRIALRARGAVAWGGAAALAWIVVAAAVWNGMGLIAGIPLDALTWLAVGLAATVAALERREA